MNLSYKNAERPAIEEKVRTTIARQLDIAPEKVTQNSRIVDDLGADSLDFIEFISLLEESLGVEIPEEEAEKLKKVGDITDLIEKIHR